MRFSLKKEDLIPELHLFQGIVEKRNTMPILANILLDVYEDRVDMTGTDLEVGLKTYSPAKGEEKGSITISGKKIFEIVKSLPEGKPIIFSEENDLVMRITSGETEFKVLCLPKEDYPQMPESKFEKNIVIPLDVLQDMIESVYFAITQEHRYYLNGALLILKDGKLEMVSTDGHRLAYVSKSLENTSWGEEIRVIVSKKTLNELRKFEDESLEFDLDESNLFFRIKNRTMVSRIIEGKFPNFEAVLPKDNPYKASISREAITDSIRRVSLLSTERSRGIKLSIEKNLIRLFSSNPEMGEARDNISLDYSGKEMEIGFNSQYILDFLTTVKSEKVVFEFKDKDSAVLMRPESEEGMKYNYVLMPMKL
ncbi:MAG: DNA polymerase III subunit beta [Candidatus Aminicenantes bacterium]|nr:DNA polymerase III subunit beta [Candidatus Aminicenantes bacterium]